MKKNGRPPTCPIDREVIDESMMHRDMICEGMLGLLVVYCTNRPNSCKWEGKQKDLEAHCRECTYKDLPQWLSRKVTIQKVDNDMFLLDDEIAEKIEREAPDVDLYTRVYFKNQSLVGEVMGKIKNVAGVKVESPEEAELNIGGRVKGKKNRRNGKIKDKSTQEDDHVSNALKTLESLQGDSDLEHLFKDD